MQKVWKKVTEIKNGIHLPQCSITSHNVEFPSPEEKVEEFVALFAKNSGRVAIRKKQKEKNLISEEKSEMYNDPNPENSLSMNSYFHSRGQKSTRFFCLLVFSCFCYCVFSSFSSFCISLRNNKVTVGLDGISYNLFDHLPEQWIQILQSFIQKCWETGKSV